MEENSDPVNNREKSRMKTTH